MIDRPCRVLMVYPRFASDSFESPDTETLMQMRKKQNTRRNIAESIHRIYAHGMFVTAGFIVGFDSEKGSVAEPMIALPTMATGIAVSSIPSRARSSRPSTGRSPACTTSRRRSAWQHLKQLRRRPDARRRNSQP